jgi:hypothetical protein
LDIYTGDRRWWCIFKRRERPSSSSSERAAHTLTNSPPSKQTPFHFSLSKLPNNNPKRERDRERGREELGMEVARELLAGGVANATASILLNW